MKSEFISTVSHELRTPLTSVRGALELLRNKVLGDFSAEASDMLQLSSKNVDRLLLLVNDILDIQKIEFGGMEFFSKEVDAVGLLKEVMQQDATFAEQFDVELRWKGEVDDAWIFVDPNRIKQALSNLVSNAVKFSPAGSSVELAIQRRDDVVRFVVKDHGVGIPKEFRNKLFDKFTQMDSSDTRKVGGTGLGLSITKAIVESQNGKIDYQTEEGRGTTFYIEMPVLGGSSSISGVLG